MTFTVTGPSGYYCFDFGTVSVAANTVEELRFNWFVPDYAGTYVVETELIPPELTAYDLVYLKVLNHTHCLLSILPKIYETLSF